MVDVDFVLLNNVQITVQYIDLLVNKH